MCQNFKCRSLTSSSRVAGLVILDIPRSPRACLDLLGIRGREDHLRVS